MHQDPIWNPKTLAILFPPIPKHHVLSMAAILGSQILFLASIMSSIVYEFPFSRNQIQSAVKYWLIPFEYILGPAKLPRSWSDVMLNKFPQNQNYEIILHGAYGLFHLE